jgi:hypothetical protein
MYCCKFSCPDYGTTCRRLHRLQELPKRRWVFHSGFENLSQNHKIQEVRSQFSCNNFQSHWMCVRDQTSSFSLQKEESLFLMTTVFSLDNDRLWVLMTVPFLCEGITVQDYLDSTVCFHSRKRDLLVRLIASYGRISFEKYISPFTFRTCLSSRVEQRHCRSLTSFG